MKKIAKILGISLLTLSLVGCGKVPQLKNGEEAVATLKEGNISANDLYNRLKETYGKDLLIELIDKMITDQKYEKVTNEEKEYIEEQIEQLETTAKNYNTTLEALIQNYGYSSLDDLKESISLVYRRREMVKEYLIGELKDKEIQKYYDEEIFGDIRAKHILIKVETVDSMTEEEKTEADKKAKKEAEDIIKKLNNKEKFDDLAKKYSDDTNTKKKGGDLGWFNTGDMLESFEDAAFALKKGEYTKSPVKTTYGYHIILKTDEKKKPALKEVKAEIQDKLVEDKLNADSTLYYETLEEIRKESELEITDTELKKQYKAYMRQLKTPTKND